MEAAISALLKLAQFVIPMVSDSAGLIKVVGLVADAVPVGIKLSAALVPEVKIFTDAIRGHSQTTAEVLAVADQLDAAADAAFDKAADRVEAEDAAADMTSTDAQPQP